MVLIHLCSKTGEWVEGGAKCTCALTLGSGLGAGPNGGGGRDQMRLGSNTGEWAV